MEEPFLTEQELDFILSRESCPVPLEWEDEAMETELDVLSMMGAEGFLWACPEDGVKPNFQNLSAWPLGSHCAQKVRYGDYGQQIDWDSPYRIGGFDPTPIVSDILQTTYEKGSGTVTFSASDGRKVSYSCFDAGGQPRLSFLDAAHLWGIISRLRNQE